METVSVHRPIRDFRPSTPPVTTSSIDDVLDSRRIVVVHFWAVWNGVDAPMDSALCDIRERLPAGTQLVSCDIDDPDCADFAKTSGVVNVPWLSIYVDGVRHGHVCGLRESDQHLATICDLISTPQNPRPWWRFW